MDGILLIDKEEGITSYDVIRKIKKILPRKTKVGHAGTLDPFATGLLIVMLGKATKLNDWLHTFPKAYTVTAQFGYETDTQDHTGKRIAEDGDLSELSKEQVEAALKDFIGTIKQTPPNYSAIKVSGKRAYKLAREGKQFKIKEREVEIYWLKLLGLNWPDLRLEAKVSTGTYIRTLVVDIAKKLGRRATPIALRRESINKFSVEYAVSSTELEGLELDDLLKEPHFIPIDKVKTDTDEE